MDNIGVDGANTDPGAGGAKAVLWDASGGAGNPGPLLAHRRGGRYGLRREVRLANARQAPFPGQLARGVRTLTGTPPTPASSATAPVSACRPEGDRHARVRNSHRREHPAPAGAPMTDLDRDPWHPARPTAPTGGTGRQSGFASLRVRNYRLFALGQTTSVVGNWMQNIAVGWLTLELTHSGTMLGVVTGARYLPILLLGAWGGLVVDRHDRRRLLMLTQMCFAVEAALLTALSWAGLMTLPTLVVIMLTIGCTNVFDSPARQSLISELVGPEHLANAIAINSTLVNTAKLIGPGPAGVVIAALGVTPCFDLDTVSFLAVIASLVALRTAEMRPAEREIPAGGQIRAGIAYIRRTPELLHPMVMVLSIWSVGWLGGTVIGAPAVGAIGASWGARSALLVGGLAAAGIGVTMLVLSPAGRAQGHR